MLTTDTQSYGYDWRGATISQTDQLGRLTNYLFDKDGEQISTTVAANTPDAATSYVEYDKAGRKTREYNTYAGTGGVGSTPFTQYQYDAAGQLKIVTNTLGHTTVYTYDMAGRKKFETDPDQHTTQYWYDTRGRLITTTLPGGSINTYQYYDLAGNVITSTDGNGNSTFYSYDPANRLGSVSNAMNQATHYYYDNVGRLQSILDANNHTTGFLYDGLGRQTDKIWPDNSSEHYGYDLAGNQTSQKLADGTTNTFGFDSLNRPITATYQDGRKVLYTYTPTGQRSTVSDSKYGGGGLVSYLYDNRDRVTQITQPNGQKVGYGYDALSNRTSLIVTATGSTTTTNYGYDAANELKVVTDSVGSATKFDYYQSGPRLDEILPIGITTTYGYDTLNRLVNITQTNTTGPVTPLATFTYKLDNAGNRTNITEVLKYTTGAATTRNLQYGYDSTYRLKTEWDSTNPTTTYQYDAVGNRLTMQVGTATPTSYGYNELDQQTNITGSDGSKATYSYKRGNLFNVATIGGLHPGTTTYTWDSANRMIGATTGGQSSAYTYDSDGHRVAQTQGGTTTNYLWDTESSYGDVLLETTGAGAFQASYVLAGGELVSQNKGGVTSYLLKDGQGSTRALFSGGTLVTAGGNQTYNYTAFGSLQTSATTVGTSYLYTGQQLDQPTGLYDLRARYYNPVDGRFLSQDSNDYDTNNPVEVNRYGYTANNPVNGFDPSGYEAVETAISWVNGKGKEIPVLAETGGATLTVVGTLDGAVDAIEARLLAEELREAVISNLGKEFENVIMKDVTIAQGEVTLEDGTIQTVIRINNIRRTPEVKEFLNKFLAQIEARGSNISAKIADGRATEHAEESVYNYAKSVKGSRNINDVINAIGISNTGGPCGPCQGKIIKDVVVFFLQSLR